MPADAELDVRGRDHPWVSRGGIKLAHAREAFDIDVTGFGAIDVGSSTGGFTDVLLTKGAARVYAVDSGTNQLAWKLRSDDRVIVHEQTSARILTQAHIPEPIDIIVCDASFISLAKVLEKPIGFARPGAHLVALIKPQFEARREEVGKNGVVRDPAERLVSVFRRYLQWNVSWTPWAATSRCDARSLDSSSSPTLKNCVFWAFFSVYLDAHKIFVHCCCDFRVFK